MASIKFFLQTDRNPAGIYVRLLDGRTIDCKAKTKYLINPAEWSKAKGRPTNLKLDAHVKLNQDLEDFKNRLLKHYNEANGANDRIDTRWLKEFINPAHTPLHLLLPYLDHYLEVRDKELANWTKRGILTVRSFLIKYQKAKKTNYRLIDFNLKFAQDFARYSYDNGYNQNSVSKYLDILKQIVKHARLNKCKVSQDLDLIKLKYTKKDIAYLSFQELDKIEALDLPDILNDTRDWLLISCEIGQRVSDFLGFNKGMILYDGDIPFINFTQTKTKTNVTIPLNKRVVRILEKRGGEFPKYMIDRTFNKKAKEICELAGFTEMCKGSIMRKGIRRREFGLFPKWQLISSHVGRRSFATNYYGIMPNPVIMAITGHKTESSFLKYIGKADGIMAMQAVKYFY